MKKIVLSFKILILLLAEVAFGQQNIFQNDDYVILSEHNEPASHLDTTYLGKACLQLDGSKRAVALLKKNDIKNFRLEMEVAAEVMAGLGFQVSDVQNYQFIYFRPGYGGTEEAIQYVPVYNGALSWVFYNAPYYERTADFASLEWFHTAIEVVDDRLRVFVDHSEEPQLDIVIEDFGTTVSNLLLRSMFGPSYFANVTIEPLVSKSSAPGPEHDVDFLRNWQISPQFQRDSIPDFEKVLQLAEGAENWRKIHDPLDDHINFCEYFLNPNGVVVAKTKLNDVPEAGKKALAFDFVGRLQIRLNGEIVFNFSRLRFDRVDDETFRVLLDLKKGSNELIFILEGDAQFFGDGYNSMGRFQHQNWGFMARIIPG